MHEGGSCSGGTEVALCVSTKPWWRHQMETFSRYWPFVWGIHRSPANSPDKGQWRGALMFPLICVWTNDWVNSRYAGHLRCCRAHYDVTVMITPRLNIKTVFPGMIIPTVKKFMRVMRRSYLYDENPCTDKTSSLCSYDPLVTIIMMKWEKLPHWYIHFWCYIRKCNGYLYHPNAVHSCDLIGWCSFMIKEIYHQTDKNSHSPKYYQST